jgi:hypothetical protein
MSQASICIEEFLQLEMMPRSKPFCKVTTEQYPNLQVKAGELLDCTESPGLQDWAGQRYNHVALVFDVLNY